MGWHPRPPDALAPRDVRRTRSELAAAAPRSGAGTGVPWGWGGGATERGNASVTTVLNYT
jgi:hypothetical protein